MARRNIPTAPQTRPDPRHETVYDPARGGHYRPEARPVPGAKQDGPAGQGRLPRGGQ
ncbi:hypothetical protein ABZ797_46545 [Streptomyces antimycoticus]|uniref:hypothetical protein n=1 Tax=Streptomyces antimycoticus TaxID=68175 RepID=UPI0033EDC941